MCIGMFDGVHRGHRMLINRTRERACQLGLRSLVFTFAAHPLSLLAPPYVPLLLSSPEERRRLIDSFGIGLCAMIDFSPDFAAISAQDFLKDIVAGICQARALVCGPDFRFGSRGMGDIDLLVQQSKELGIEVEVCEPLIEGNCPVKSTRIRQCLLEGRVEEANGLLGHPYTLTGLVVEGDRRGRTIGYPTANLKPPERRLVPHDGIYAVRATLPESGLESGREFNAMLYIGLRPTFDKEERSIEVYLFDFSGDLYGRELRVTFAARIRGERKFESVPALIEQLHADEAACRQLLAAKAG